MPRIYDSMSDPWDFCKKCFPAETEAKKRFGGNDNIPEGGGLDGRGNCFGYEEDHPEYEGTDYRCEDCGCLLTDRDN